MAGTPGERLIAAEWLAVMVVQTGDAFGESNNDQFTLPEPSRYWASIAAYLMLAGLALFGEGPARLAGALGGVAALAILLAPPQIGEPISSTNQPLIVRFFGYLAKMYQTGPAGPGSLAVNSAAQTAGQGVAAISKGAQAAVGSTTPGSLGPGGIQQPEAV
jgi:hypothetical protein